MQININGQDHIAAGAAALALVAAMMQDLDPTKRADLVRLAESMIGSAPNPPQPPNGHLRALIVSLIQDAR